MYQARDASASRAFFLSSQGASGAVVVLVESVCFVVFLNVNKHQYIIKNRETKKTYQGLEPFFLSLQGATVVVVVPVAVFIAYLDVKKHICTIKKEKKTYQARDASPSRVFFLPQGASVACRSSVEGAVLSCQRWWRPTLSLLCLANPLLCFPFSFCTQSLIS